MSKRKVFLFAMLLAAVSCIAAASGNVQPAAAKETEGEIISEVFGDLDGDSIPERVVAFRNETVPGEAPICEIRIYRNVDAGWGLWYKAIGPIENVSFKELGIERRAIVVKHYCARYFYTHRYRCNAGRWELIGATVTHNGLRCTDYTETDYNLSTGSISYFCSRAACEDCDPETDTETYRHKLGKLPEMNGFHPGENELVIAKCKAGLWY
jgi:hypothetical protein